MTLKKIVAFVDKSAKFMKFLGGFLDSFKQNYETAFGEIDGTETEETNESETETE